jgi:hypothetical protein
MCITEQKLEAILTTLQRIEKLLDYKQNTTPVFTTSRNFDCPNENNYGYCHTYGCPYSHMAKYGSNNGSTVGASLDVKKSHDGICRICPTIICQCKNKNLK